MELRDLRGRDQGGPAPVNPPASQVVTVFSPKGGVGKTLLACGIAMVSASMLGRRTLLVDLDLDSGDVAVHLDLPEGGSVNDLIPYSGDLRPETLKRFTILHKASGVEVVPAPARPEMSEFVKCEHVASLIDAARRHYQTIVVDSPPALDDDVVYECLQRSDVQVLIVTQDLASLRQARTALELLRRLGFDPDERTKIIVNRFTDDSHVSQAKIRSFLQVQNLSCIREARGEVEQSILDGLPVVLHKTQSAVAMDIVRVAHDALGAPLSQRVNEKPNRFLQAVRRLW